MNMKKDDTFGDHLTLLAMSAVYEMQFVVLSSNRTENCLVSCTAEYDPQKSIGFIGYDVDCLHYVSLGKQEKMSDVLVSVRGMENYGNVATDRRDLTTADPDISAMSDDNRPTDGAEVATPSRTLISGNKPIVQGAVKPKVVQSKSSVTIADSAFPPQIITHFHRNGRHYVSCKVCSKNADVVRSHTHQGRLPAIATEAGTVFRKEIVADHLLSEWHIESLKCEHFSALTKVEMTQQAPMDKFVSKANEALANKVGGLMVTVYNDAKRLTLSANSWPSRIVATQKAANFSCNIPDYQPSLDLQYVTPKCHKKFLTSHVDAHRQDVLTRLLKCRALSLRLNGSVDRTQVDKIYVLVKCIDQCGNVGEIFLGASEPEKRGAVGVLHAMKEAIVTNFGQRGLELLKLKTSVVTDGASINTGERKGFWKLFESELRSSQSAELCPSLPLVKVWCAVHRSQLAWQSVSETVAEVKHCFQSLISLVTYFHPSGVRSRELNELAAEKHFQLRHLPTVYEVRWTEFSYALLNAVLVSWQALVSYFQQSKDVAAKGHFSFLTSFPNLQLLVFLADVLFIFAQFQKRLQSDSTTLIDMHESVSNISIFYSPAMVAHKQNQNKTYKEKKTRSAL